MRCGSYTAGAEAGPACRNWPGTAGVGDRSAEEASAVLEKGVGWGYALPLAESPRGAHREPSGRICSYRQRGPGGRGRPPRQGHPFCLLPARASAGLRGAEGREILERRGWANVSQERSVLRGVRPSQDPKTSFYSSLRSFFFPFSSFSPLRP